jgi:transposase InsO family protein
MEEHKVTERRACRALAISRTAYRYISIKLPDEDEITAKIIEYASKYGRVGYRKVAYMLRNDNILINHKRVERIWRQAGLKLPDKQSKKQRIWLNDGSCIRLRPEHENHVWSYDFIEDRTMDGRKIRFLNVIDEYTRECLVSVPRRSWRGNDVIEQLAEVMIFKGCPEYIRSDNGKEFVATKLRTWLKNLGVITKYIEPGSPWENGYCESFNAIMRDEFLDGELFGNMAEAAVLSKRWNDYYNHRRPHGALKGKPPAPVSFVPSDRSRKEVAAS